MKTLLIDGDLVLHRACAAVEREVRWDAENHMLFSNSEEAWDAVSHELNKLFERFDTTTHVIALSLGRNFRHGIDPTYKHNRKGLRKPMAFAEAAKRLQREYRCVAFDGLEADDVMGIFGSRDPEDTIICSADKDMRTIPCTLWDGKDVRRISKAEADYAHMMQTLTGDTADGYTGCPGVGPVKAERILIGDTPGAGVWDAVVASFVKAGLTADDALRQARLARILRNTDWNWDKKEPILWTPPTQPQALAS